MSFRSVFSLLILIPAILIVPSTCIAADDDGRNSLILRPKERALMLEDMRHYLVGIKEITKAIATEDSAAIEAAARSMGQIAIYNVKPVMSANLVPKFRDLGLRLHNKFEALADAAAAGRKPLQLLGDLSLLMTQCVKCHESYKVGDFSHNKDN